MLARKSGGKLGRLGGRSLQAVSCDVPRPARRRIPFDPAPGGSKPDTDHAARYPFAPRHSGLAGAAGRPEDGEPRIDEQPSSRSPIRYIPQYILDGAQRRVSFGSGRRQYRSASRHHGKRRRTPYCRRSTFLHSVSEANFVLLRSKWQTSLPLDSDFRRCDRFRALNRARV